LNPSEKAESPFKLANRGLEAGVLIQGIDQALFAGAVVATVGALTPLIKSSRPPERPTWGCISNYLNRIPDQSGIKSSSNSNQAGFLQSS